MLVNEETIKLIANDHTIILENFPDVTKWGPKIILNRSSPKKTITRISETAIIPTIYRIGLSSDRKLSFRLNFSAILCNKTFDIDDAIKARGIESRSFDWSKKPAVSDPKNLFINIGGRR